MPDDAEHRKYSGQFWIKVASGLRRMMGKQVLLLHTCPPPSCPFFNGRHQS